MEVRGGWGKGRRDGGARRMGEEKCVWEGGGMRGGGVKGEGKKGGMGGGCVLDVCVKARG